jgi:hypothetical protein
VPFDLPAIPIDLFWSARYHRDPANRWLRTLMVDTFANGEASRAQPPAIVANHL